MTFETWWDNAVCTDIDAGVDQEVVARMAWNAAIKRCADIVTEHDVRFGGYGRAPLFVREELRQEIERGVQDQTTATRRQGTEGTSGETGQDGT